ncbi:response regulator transcription factor [Parabacteroides acidifaciens]|uniref:DNA-binding response regulator n=1 Tax=Parabacteroides acidifaciens TaxID=2290935 RepID=A0A3D8H996_9BACT|nr:response regulator transcription factor [Parabacteroides acidifaciens]MBC8603714.1 response regulator transcription factor [Parabacteroides acidifaciens]RDU47556.1 DNA-binding response regulator [Parabacteroides acidifaciens]
MNTLLTIAIADPSAIIRSGLETVLKRLPGFRIQVVEIATMELLLETLRSQRPDMLVINPAIPGCFSLQQIKEEAGCTEMKCIALLYAVADHTLLRPYDEQISIYDSPDELRHKLELLHTPPAEEAGNEEQQTLSTREKEIVVCVVKGMTNREIADRLFLSTHTVVTHRRNIARKLQIHSASGLTVYAIVNKLVELNDIKL